MSRIRQRGSLLPGTDTTLPAVGESSQGYLWPAEDQQDGDEDSDDDEEVDPRNLSVTRLGALFPLRNLARRI